MRNMLRTRFFALATALAALTGVGSVSAQDFTFGWNPRSGDVWVDTYLGDVNRYGGRYRDPFVNEMVRYYGAPRDLVVDLLVARRWAPGDVYFACAIAQILGRPCRYVVDYWDQHHGKGWGVVAKELGIKPGSPEFHRLKMGFVPTYDRWGRTIELSPDLHDDFPGRAKGPKTAQGKPAKAGGEHGQDAAHGGKGADKATGKPGGKGKAKDGEKQGNKGGGKG